MFTEFYLQIDAIRGSQNITLDPHYVEGIECGITSFQKNFHPSYHPEDFQVQLIEVIGYLNRNPASLTFLVDTFPNQAKESGLDRLMSSDEEINAFNIFNPRDPDAQSIHVIHRQSDIVTFYPSQSGDTISLSKLDDRNPKPYVLFKQGKKDRDEFYFGSTMREVFLQIIQAYPDVFT